MFTRPKNHGFEKKVWVSNMTNVTRTNVFLGLTVKEVSEDQARGFSKKNHPELPKFIDDKYIYKSWF